MKYFHFSLILYFLLNSGCQTEKSEDNSYSKKQAHDIEHKQTETYDPLLIYERNKKEEQEFHKKLKDIKFRDYSDNFTLGDLNNNFKFRINDSLTELRLNKSDFPLLNFLKDFGLDESDIFIKNDNFYKIVKLEKGKYYLEIKFYPLNGINKAGIKSFFTIEFWNNETELNPLEAKSIKYFIEMDSVFIGIHSDNHYFQNFHVLVLDKNFNPVKIFNTCEEIIYEFTYFKNDYYSNKFLIKNFPIGYLQINANDLNLKSATNNVFDTIEVYKKEYHLHSDLPKRKIEYISKLLY